MSLSWAPKIKGAASNQQPQFLLHQCQSHGPKIGWQLMKRIRAQLDSKLEWGQLDLTDLGQGGGGWVGLAAADQQPGGSSSHSSQCSVCNNKMSSMQCNGSNLDEGEVFVLHCQKHRSPVDSTAVSLSTNSLSNWSSFPTSQVWPDQHNMQLLHRDFQPIFNPGENYLCGHSALLHASTNFAEAEY